MVNYFLVEMKKKFSDKCPKLLRIFGEQQELADFPLPGVFAKNQTPLTGEMQEVSLHFLVRRTGCEKAESLLKFDQKFKDILNFPRQQGKSENIRKEIHATILAYKETLKEVIFGRIS